MSVCSVLHLQDLDNWVDELLLLSLPFPVQSAHPVRRFVRVVFGLRFVRVWREARRTGGSGYFEHVLF